MVGHGGVHGGALARAIAACTRGRTLAEARLGREGWVRLEVECHDAGGARWVQIELEFAAVATLSRPGREGLFLHPFALTLSCNGERAGDWDDTLSAHWGGLVRRGAPDLVGQGAERLEISGTLPLVDLRLPTTGVLEVHVKLPWRDRDKREGFEASSELEHAAVRVATLGVAARVFGRRGLERVQIGS